MICQILKTNEIVKVWKKEKQVMSLGFLSKQMLFTV